MKTKKRYIAPAVATLLLSATIFSSGLVACSPTNSKANANETQITTQMNNSDKHTHISENVNHKTNASLAKINPTFSDTTWLGEHYTEIDEESLLQIIRIAMKDAEEMYLSIGAKNMKLNNTTQKPTDTFYPDWMDEYYFLSRAKKESVYMIDFIGPPVNKAGDRAKGTMGTVLESLVPTLNQYMSDTFNSDITFEKYQNVIPSKNDLNNYEHSKEARDNLKENVYNSVYLSICYDIYNTKCTGPNHKDYYVNLGGYKEETRKKVVTALYLFKRDDVISSLRNGTFNDTFGNSQYVKDILSNQSKFKNTYENKFQFGN